jgi:hypothetical protein
MREVGAAMFLYEGKSSPAPVIFGEPGDAVLPGVLALQVLGLVFDLLRRELRPAVLPL